MDPLDACEKGQAEPWLGGLWGSKMVSLFVLLNFSDDLIDDETDAVAALFCCCCSGRYRATAMLATRTSSAPVGQAQRLLGKWRSAPLASDLEVFLSDPDM